jgi:2,4-dienoyl-CoA reductase-like NADH-dependent reductase (Old Yellow Enzyme family)
MLFEPLRIKNLTLRNRYVMPPMVSNMSVTSGQAIAYYRERARGGVGLVIVEAVHVDRFSYQHFRNGLKHLAKAVHDEGAAIAIQLFHNNVFDCQETDPTRITKEQISRLKRKFVYAAVKAREAGFDGVEPHGAHGYFLNQFFSPKRNRRTDEYGGSLENRMRMGLEIVSAIRENLDPDAIMLYRHTPVGMGYTLEESVQFAVELERAGLDVMDVSPSTGGDGEHAGLAAAIKSSLNIPVIAVGGMEDPEMAEKALTDGKCDLVAVGRGLIADPYLPRKVMEGRRDEITRCVKCSEKCFGNLQAGLPISCTQNPKVGLEYLGQKL